MTPRFGLALGASLIALTWQPAAAEPPTVESLIARSQEDGAALAALLAQADAEVVRAYIAGLSQSEAEALLRALVAADAAPVLIASVARAAITARPEEADAVITALSDTVAPEDRPQIAASLQGEVAGLCGSAAPEAFTPLVLGTVSLDSAAADGLVALGNTAGPECAEALARALAEITVTASDLIASNIELALAIEGGTMAQLVSAARGEVDVAATPEPPAGPAAVVPAGPAVAPGTIGGGAATPGGGAPGASAVANTPASGVVPGVAGGGNAPRFTPLGLAPASVSDTGTGP